MELVQYKDAVIARDIQHPALKKVVDYLKTHDVSQDEKGHIQSLMISFTM